MTKTGARAAALNDLLVATGLERVSRLKPPRLEDFSSATRQQIIDLYRSLGGPLSEPAFRPGAWNLPYGKVVVELDEDMHFNRYRAVTLATSFAMNLPWATDYRRYCAEQEHRSGTGGKRWTNRSAERMFGPAAEHWSFDGGGAPRWKQRALYDAIKDAAAISGRAPLSRVSIYDAVKVVRLDDVLRGRSQVDPQVALTFVESRVVHLASTS